MKFIFYLLVFIFFTSYLFAQDTSIEELVKQGVELHEAGKYSEAIKKYEEALKINENSPLANYEMAVTCMALEMYDFATKHGTIALVESDSDSLKDKIYLLIANILDFRSLPYEAINIYEEALQLYPNNYLLSYNLAITYFNIKEYEKAESSVIASIKANTDFSDSYFFLHNLLLKLNKGNQALLSGYLFLMLEPNSDRSKIVLKRIEDIFEFNETQQFKQIDNREKIVINIPTASDEDIEKGVKELMNQVKKRIYNKSYNKSIVVNIGYQEANYLSVNQKKINFFANSTDNFFQSKLTFQDKHKYFWEDFFMKKFLDLKPTNNLVPFCYYISQSLNSPEVVKWIENNQEKIDALRLWIDLNK